MLLLPVLMRDFTQCICCCCAVRSTESTLGVFPAFMDRDFLYPMLLTKFWLMLYGGLCSNAYGVTRQLLRDSAPSHLGGSIVSLQTPHLNIKAMATSVLVNLFPATSCHSTKEFLAVWSLLAGQVMQLDIGEKESVSFLAASFYRAG